MLGWQRPQVYLMKWHKNVARDTFDRPPLNLHDSVKFLHLALANKILLVRNKFTRSV